MQRRYGLICATVLLMLPAIRLQADEMQSAPEVLDVERARLAEALEHSVGAFGNWVEDSNEITIWQAGGEGRAWLTPELPLDLQVIYGTVAQSLDDQPRVTIDRMLYAAKIHEFFLSPAWALMGKLSYEDFRSTVDDDLWGGGLGVLFRTESLSTFKAGVLRESFWSRYDQHDPRTYPRVNRITGQNPNFHVDTVAATADLTTLLDQRVRLEGSYSEYEDDNEQLALYAHYQWAAFRRGDDRWTAIRPSLYYEHFSEQEEIYYSPDYHVTLGICGHHIHRIGASSEFEIEVTPFVVFRDETGFEEETEVGVHGAAELQAPAGPLVMALGASGYYETDEYWIYRVIGRLFCRF